MADSVTTSCYSCLPRNQTPGVTTFSGRDIIRCVCHEVLRELGTHVTIHIPAAEYARDLRLLVEALDQCDRLEGWKD